MMRLGIAAIISDQPDMAVVAQAGTGEQAVDLFRRHKPQVTLMDLRLPGMSGVEAIRAIRRESPRARFVVLTTYEGDEDVHQARPRRSWTPCAGYTPATGSCHLQ